jgi:CheY-like chemotaxis protein
MGVEKSGIACGKAVENGARGEPPRRKPRPLTVCLPLAYYFLSANRPAGPREGVRRRMLHHRAFGRHLDTLTVAVIDNRRPILSLMRAMLAAIGVGRIETYESPTEALDALRRVLPDVLIAAATMQPMNGPALVRAMRRASTGPLSLVPAMIMSAHATPSLVEEALKAGAHQVLVLPTTASTLYRRLDWLINDDCSFELRGDHYVVACVEERLSLSIQRPVYMPARPEAPPSAVAGEEAFPIASGSAKKARAAPH